MNQATLRQFIKKAPHETGIYIFKKTNTRFNLVLGDTHKKYLYIGKATNLKKRVGSYLKTEDVRIKKMLQIADSLKFRRTDSDIEALILESQLIKKFRPQFNIMLRDDKQYASIGFTAEKYPKIFITHQPAKNLNFIGPFTDVEALKTTLRYLRYIFSYCTCKQLHNNFCLNFHINKCPGFCCLKKPTTDARQTSAYKTSIRTIKDILNGKKVTLIKRLEKEMKQLAQKGELEKAIELRNKISGLRRIFKNAMIIKNSDILKTNRSGLESLLKLQKPIIRIEGYDVSNIGGAHATGSMITFISGQPDKNFYRKFKVQTRKTPDDTAMLKEMLKRRFRHDEWPSPDLILIDGGKGQLNAARAAISKKIPIIALTKNKKHVGEKIYISGQKTPLALTKLSPADRNLLLAISSEAHRFAISYYRKLHQKLFK